MDTHPSQPRQRFVTLALLLAGSLLLASPVARSQVQKSPPGWVTPTPYYDEMINPGLKELHLLIEIQTDKEGKVGRVAVYQGSGIRTLDDRVIAFAMLNWKGPPNSKLRVPITYKKRPPRTGSYL